MWEQFVIAWLWLSQAQSSHRSYFWNGRQVQFLLIWWNVKGLMHISHILGIPLAHKITYYKTNVFAALKCSKIQNESQDIVRYQAISPSITVKLRCKIGNYWETQAVLGNYCAQVTNHLQLATIWLPCCSFGTHLEPQAPLLPGPSVAPVEQTERGNLPTTSLDRWQWEQRYIHCKAGKTMKFSMQQLPN